MRFAFTLLLVATAVGFVTGATAPASPNIVFLFSDDQSVPDLGCYGNRALKTPTLDQLARERMRFTRAYVTQTVVDTLNGTQRAELKR